MYIRTKDGVYDSENDDIVKIDGKYKKCYVQKDTGDTCFKDIEVINVSENLEELCDRYVGISNNKPMIIKYEFDEYYDEYGDTYTKEELLMEYDIVYGAIYTDKGLLYVAKMNQEGELELI